MATIKASTSGASFTISDYYVVNGTAVSTSATYPANSVAVASNPETGEVVFTNMNDNRIILRALATDILNGDTDEAFADLDELIAYTDANFFVSAGGAGEPGGDDTQIQFNDGGTFAGDGDLTWNKISKLLSAGNLLIGDGVTDPSIQSSVNILTGIARTLIATSEDTYAGMQLRNGYTNTWTFGVLPGNEDCYINTNFYNASDNGIKLYGNGNIKLQGVTWVYADNAEAIADGRVPGDVYRTSTGQLMIVYTP